MYDAIVVGAGPAGLNAALILGRCRRRVLVCDTGAPRNAASHALRGFLSRDGVPPGELLRVGREQLARYETVTVQSVEVTGARARDGGFDVTLSDGGVTRCRKLLLATGVTDVLPALDGFSDLYGVSAFHCPYCDGWAVRDQPLAIYGRGEHGLGLALELTAWSGDLVLCTDGPSGLSGEHYERLRRHIIALREQRIARLEGERGFLSRILFVTGVPLPRRALFFSTGEDQRSALAE